MHLVTATKEPWDFWYELSDWVLKYLDMGSMRGDVIAPKATPGTSYYVAAMMGKKPQRESIKEKYCFIIRAIRFEDSQTPSLSKYDEPGMTRKRGAKTNPMELAIYIGPEAVGRKERAFTAILHMGAALAEFGAPALPEGDLAFYRQPIGGAFMENRRTLLKEWRK